MRQLYFTRPGELQWRQSPEPQLESDLEALVRPLAVATCDLDRMIVRGGLELDGEFAFGHECVAEVIDVGDAVKSASCGDLVSVPFQISCGTCAACIEGRTANCTTVPRISMYGLGPLSGAEWGGFFADVVRVPFADHMLLPIPVGVPPEAVACLSDNIADAWRTVGPALEQVPGAPILIAGTEGSVGLYAAAIALALGSERVDWVGGGEHERNLAEQLGATVVADSFPERLGPYPITVDASGHQDGLTCAVRSTAPDGLCTSIGIYFDPKTSIPLLEMYTKGICFQTGRVHARSAMTRALDLVRAGRLHPELITGQVVGWEDAPDAVAAHESKLVVSRAS